ncbi:hypothetical protein YS9_3402, partial [Enterococcus sp. C1]
SWHNLDPLFPLIYCLVYYTKSNPEIDGLLDQY